MRFVGLVGLFVVPSFALAQTVVPYATLPPNGALPAAASWALPGHETRRATIVSALPMARRYRVCNASNTTAVVATDAHPDGFDLPGRTCTDLAARTITISQRVPGIPPFGTYTELPFP